ncbi:MAG: hypoxanthine phosphoribosyltransferase [Coriobacteriia bacterium]|nr:hypoxanthine phosphoribosyltransferase [Coriobacteriia bacterium]
MHSDIVEILFTEDEIAAAVREMGARISADYKGKKLLLVAILKGSFVFMADLIRCIEGDVEVDFMAVSSYGAEAKHSGVVRINKDLEGLVENYHVLLVEDILDSGLTLTYLRKYLRSRNPQSLEIATLLLKEGKQEVPVDCKYVGLLCPDAFLVGYGLDYAERYRNLPYVGVLDPKIYV